jgi:hypothetical protein
MEFVVHRLEILVGVTALLAPAALVFVEAALQVGQHAFELLLERMLAAVLVEGEADFLALRTFQDELALLGRQFVPRLVEIDIEGGRDGVENLLEEGAVAPLPRVDGTLAQAQIGIDDDALGIEVHGRADAVAGGACARGVVEREQAWSYFRQPDAARGAGKFLGEEQVLSFEG